jgi:hypothetical protein
MPVAPDNRFRIAELLSRATAVADIVTERIANEYACAPHRKHPKATEQAHTNGSDRLGNGEFKAENVGGDGEHGRIHRW